MKLVPIRVLLVEDSPSDADLLLGTIKSAPVVHPEERELDITWVETLESAKLTLKAAKFDLILLDMTLPDTDGIRAISHLQEQFETIPIVVLTGLNDRNLAALAVKKGAQDYLVKGLPSADSIRRAIRYAMERKATELARKNLSLVEQREKFLAMLAHDLRSPLTGCDRVLGAILAEKLGPLSPLQMQALTAMNDGLRSVQAIITDVLERYSLQSDVEVLNLRQWDLGRVVKECILEFEDLARVKDIRLKQSGASCSFALIDPISMRRVVSNLLANALKFTPAGGEIEAKIESSEEAVLIYVIDSGPGIAKEKTKHLFDRFFQCHPSERQSGIGLGLYICQELMRAQHGSIRCESELNRGTTFILEVAKVTTKTEDETFAA